MFRLSQITKDYREAPALCSQVNLFGFVDDEIFLTKSGDLGIMISIEGVDYECLDSITIENLTRRLTAAFRIFDENAASISTCSNGIAKIFPSRPTTTRLWMRQSRTASPI